MSERKHEHSQWLTGDGLGAAHALLCIQVAEAFEAVGVVFPGGEALTRQLLSAADAKETLAVPGLVLVGHSTCCDGLEATHIQTRLEWNTVTFLSCYAAFYLADTLWVTFNYQSQGDSLQQSIQIKHSAVTLPSYKRSTGRQTASRSRARRSSQCLLGWRTWFLLAAGSGGTGSRSHASCSPCIPFCGNLAQGTRAA